MGELARVLVVDDEPAVCASVEALLSTEFQVAIARNGLEAEKVLLRDHFDVVLTDYHMPQVSGLVLLRKIMQRHPSTVGILMTANAAYPEVRAAQHEWRDFRVIIKPYDPEALLAMVRNAAVFSRLRRATNKLDRTRQRKRT